jgi:hypothetical protein
MNPDELRPRPLWSLSGPTVPWPMHQGHRKNFETRALIHAWSCSPPCVCDGWEVCVHLFHRSGRIPCQPILSARSENEKMEIVRGLQTALQPLTLLAFSPPRRKRDPERWTDVIIPLIKDWAHAHDFRPDHNAVWHRSPAWMDTASEPDSDKTWRQARVGKQECWE